MALGAQYWGCEYFAMPSGRPVRDGNGQHVRGDDGYIVREYVKAVDGIRRLLANDRAADMLRAIHATGWHDVTIALAVPKVTDDQIADTAQARDFIESVWFNDKTAL